MWLMYILGGLLGVVISIIIGLRVIVSGKVSTGTKIATAIMVIISSIFSILLVMQGGTKKVDDKVSEQQQLYKTHKVKDYTLKDYKDLYKDGYKDYKAEYLTYNSKTDKIYYVIQDTERKYVLETKRHYLDISDSQAKIVRVITYNMEKGIIKQNLDVNRKYDGDKHNDTYLKEKEIERKQAEADAKRAEEAKKRQEEIKKAQEELQDKKSSKGTSDEDEEEIELIERNL